MNKTRKNNRIFKKSDLSSGDGMLTTVWGPSIWLFLHTMSFNYPVDPTIEDKHNYRQFILSLQHVLPCKYCRLNIKKNFKKLPIQMSDMKNRETFSKYVYHLHELVNDMLGKKSGLSYCDVRERFEHFRARCTVDQFIEEKKTKKEKGCVEPLYGKKSKCITKIVPQDSKNDTFQMDETCLRHRE
jgi:hypothetical protein